MPDLHTKKVQRVAYRAAWYQANKERLRDRRRAALKAWRSANPEKYRAQSKAWRDRNKAKCRAWTRAWRMANPEKVRAKEAAWKKANPDLLKSYARKNYLKNPHRVISNAKAFERRQIATIGDYYARKKLSRDSEIPMNAWPDSLVQLKRAELQLKRYLKAYGKTKEHN